MDEKPIIVRYFLFHYWCSLLFSFFKLFSSFLSASAIHSFTFGLLTPCFLTRVHLAFDFGLSVLNCLFSVSLVPVSKSLHSYVLMYTCTTFRSASRIGISFISHSSIITDIFTMHILTNSTNEKH